MHPFELGEPVSGRYILVDLPGDRIEGSLDRLAKFHFTVIAAARILRSVFDLLILYQRPGIVLPLKSRSIHHKRLYGTSGLPVALERAVERKCGFDLLGPSADHCDDLPGAVVYTDGSALHFILSVIRRIRER